MDRAATDLIEAFRGRAARGANAAHPEPRPWYSIRNLAAGEAEIFIYDFIGGDLFGGGVAAADFVRELRAINAPRILLRINSPGGDIADSLAIRTALAEHPSEIETHVDGLAASSATWISPSRVKVVMAPHARMMIHEPWDIVVGNAEKLQKVAAVLEVSGGEIAEMYTEKAGAAGGSAAEWREKMRAETWFTDEEAVAAGLADEVADVPASTPAAENRYDPAILTIYRNTPRELLPDAARDADPPPAAPPAPTTPPPELVKAALAYQRDDARRRGVLVDTNA